MREEYDNVNHPKHYMLPNGGESVDVIRMVLTHEEYEGWCKGNLEIYRPIQAKGRC